MSEKEVCCYLIEYTGWTIAMWWDGVTFTARADKAMRFNNIGKAKDYMDTKIQLEEACITEHIFYEDQPRIIRKFAGIK